MSWKRLADRTGPLAGLGIAGVLGAAAPAVAQIAPAAGPGYAPPGVVSTDPRQRDFDVIGQILYDSNVARSDAAVAAARGLKPQDVIFTPTATFNVVQPVGRESVYLRGSAGYDFYAVNTVLNSSRLSVHGGASGQFAICGGTVSGSYARFQQDLALQSALSVKNIIDIETIGLDSSCGRPTGLAPTFSVSQTWETNSSAEQSRFNYESFNVSGGLAYRRPTFGALTLYGAYTDTTYPNRSPLANLLGLTDGTHIYSGGLRFDRKLGGRIEGVFSLSYTSIVPTLPGGNTFGGPTYSVDVTYRASSRLRAHGLFERAPVPSNRLGSTYSLNQTLAVDGTYDLSQRIILRLGASRFTENYGGGVTNLPELTNQTIYDVFGSATYKLNRRWSANLNARWEQSDANLPGLSYSDERVGLTVTAGF